jgi:hypothetical protein
MMIKNKMRTRELEEASRHSEKSGKSRRNNSWLIKSCSELREKASDTQSQFKPQQQETFEEVEEQ